MNKLSIHKKKSNAVVIGSKCQLKSLNVDDFTICVDSGKLLLANQAKYLGLWVRSDLSWDDHILELCENVSLFSYASSFKKKSPICFTSQHI